MSCKSVMLVSRVVAAFSWVGDTKCWVEGTSCLGCSRRPQSSSQTGAGKIVTTRLNVRTLREAQMLLKSATKKFLSRNLCIDLWTYCRSSLDIPSYRLCSKFFVPCRLGLWIERERFSSGMLWQEIKAKLYRCTCRIQLRHVFRRLPFETAPARDRRWG